MESTALFTLRPSIQQDASKVEVSIGKPLLEAILGFAREQHPCEVVLLLRGRFRRNVLAVEDFLVPPLAVAGSSFAEFPMHMLPIDFSIIGTVHSHPSGSLKPSVGDLNNFYGRIMVILAYPYTTMMVAAFNGRGERVPIRVLG